MVDRKRLDHLRFQMVTQQLEKRGISDTRILEVFRQVPRHLFVPERLEKQAYEDHPIPIGLDQTISQPYIVALMTQSLLPEASFRILEVGTGSGYQAAILASLCESVYTIERIPELSTKARERLCRLGFKNVFFRVGNGAEGWPDFAPYDGILVSCAVPFVPPALLSQMKEGRRMVIPLGGFPSQILTLLWKQKGEIFAMEVCGCAFVPLIEKTVDHHASS